MPKVVKCRKSTFTHQTNKRKKQYKQYVCDCIHPELSNRSVVELIDLLIHS